MTNEYLTLLKEAEEDVVLEGSELFQALINAGCNNFDSVPRVNTEFSIEIEPSTLNNYTFFHNIINEKVNFICQCLSQESELQQQILKIILEGNILLDDHAAIVNDFLTDEQFLLHRKNYRKVLKWFPFITSIIIAPCYSLIMKKTNIGITAASLTLFGFLIHKKLKHWNTIKNLRHFITLQTEMHHLLKQILKILRRSHGNKLIINEIHEKKDLIGPEKYTVILSMKQLIIEIFENLSHVYYEKGSKILNILPCSLHLDCILTKFEVKHEQADIDKSYEDLKSLYYTFILVQSEMMFIMANAYHGKEKNISFQVPKTELGQIIHNLTKQLADYYSKMSKLMQNYQLCEVQPIKRVFRGIPNSKWQDVYIHLDLTSQRIQLAYKQILSILESIDIYDEKDHKNPNLVECIIDKMNEAYKQIENAKSFAEFSTLLIAKVQYKPVNNSETNEIENLFPINDDNKSIIIDKDPEIEDEVFEEYIKEEYLKPLYENNDGNIIQDFKLDKLLAKNFMTELKEALIEKQKSMTERELKALKRMYNRVVRDSSINKIESEKLSVSKISTTSTSITLSLPTSVTVPLIPTPPPLPSLPPTPPLPLLSPTPPLILTDANYIQNNKKQQIKFRTPIPLPRVKMLQPDDILPNTERFSINQCTSKLHFPTIQLTEETFMGSGENSEEENVED